MPHRFVELAQEIDRLQVLVATMAVGQFDLGPAAAFSVVYFLFILLFCWLFYTSVVRQDES